jgi:hypothetical protein
LAENEIERVGLLAHDVAHRFDRVFEAFAAVDQAEGRDHAAAAQAEDVLGRVGVAERHVRHAVMDHVDLQRVDPVPRGQDLLPGGRQDDDGAGGGADRAHHAQVVVGGLGEHGMQRHDHRLAHQRDQVDDPLAVVAAEQTELVLDVERVGGVLVDELGDRPVGRTVVLDQLCHHRRRVVARRRIGFLDRDDFAAAEEAAVETVDDVFGEGRNSAFTGRIRTEKEHPRCVHESPLVAAGPRPAMVKQPHARQRR